MKHCVASALKDRNLELEDAALVRTCEELADTFSFGADELAMEIERLLFSRCGTSVATGRGSRGQLRLACAMPL